MPAFSLHDLVIRKGDRYAYVVKITKLFNLPSYKPLLCLKVLGVTKREINEKNGIKNEVEWKKEFTYNTSAFNTIRSKKRCCINIRCQNMGL